MTMTDTEAKALEIELRKVAAGFYSEPDVFQTARFAADHIEATEARHAAELREQAERFSDVAAKVNAAIVADNRLYAQSLLAPDPLKSWLHKSGYEGNSVVEQALADITKSGGKIVWEAGE